MVLTGSYCTISQVNLKYFLLHYQTHPWASIPMQQLQGTAGGKYEEWLLASAITLYVLSSGCAVWCDNDKLCAFYGRSVG